MLEDLQKYFAGTIIPSKDMNTLAEAVRILRALAGDNFFVDASGVYHRKAPNILETVTARLTALSSDVYDWKEVVGKTDGTFVDVEDGRVSDDLGKAIDPTGGNGWMVGDTSPPVLLRRQTDPDSGDTLWMIVGIPSPVLIPVLLTQTGGSNGNQTTAASWTYNATDISSNPIAGGPFSPSWQRPKGKRIAATHGHGYYDPSGNFVLEQTDEVKDTGHC